MLHRISSERAGETATAGASLTLADQVISPPGDRRSDPTDNFRHEQQSLDAWTELSQQTLEALNALPADHRNYAWARALGHLKRALASVQSIPTMSHEEIAHDAAERLAILMNEQWDARHPTDSPSIC